MGNNDPMTAPTHNYPHLLSPLPLGGITLRNRLVMGSMHTGLEDNLTDFADLAAFYAARAHGGVGLIITGGFSPTWEGRLTPHNCTTAAGPMTPDEFITAHQTVTRAVHDGGAYIFLQLLHAGRYAYHPDAVSADNTQSPISPYPAAALSTQQVYELIAAYARGARLALDAGYDGVQVMGSEGYLINQFLAPRTNHRTDEFGGSAANRRRLPVEIVRAIRAEVGPDVPIDYRISILELVEGGQTWEEIEALAHELVDAGVNVFTAGIGWHEARIPTIVTSVPRAAFAWAAARLQAVVPIPVVVSNRINDLEVAESLLDGRWVETVGCPEGVQATPGQPAGQLVSMARPWLADASIGVHAMAGTPEKIVTCIGCNQACLDHTFSGKRASCLLNPIAGHERELPITPASARKRIAVVGAGMAGMFFAQTAASRGHEVEVFEAADTPGGQFRLAATIPGKEEFVGALQGAVGRLKALGVPVRCGQAVDPQQLAQEFDEVVVASGVTPRVPGIPGLEEHRLGHTHEGTTVVTYQELLSGAEVGDAVAVIGAGGIGFDVCEFLMEKHRAVSVQEWSAAWGVGPEGLVQPRPEFQGRRVHMLQRKPSKQGKSLGTTTGWVHRAVVAMAGVVQWSGVSYEEITDEGLVISVAPEAVPARPGVEVPQPSEGVVRLTLPVDTVVLCSGQESVRLGAQESESVHIIGGADVAAEVDAKRAIDQAVRLALVM